MIAGSLSDVNERTLVDLCESNSPETISLEFKQQLYDSTPEARAEFLKDVCALANAEGGDLVFGIAEAKGGAGRIVPLSVPNADKAMRKMGQILDGSIEPRLPTLQWKTVEVKGGYVLVLRIPRSPIGPHRFVVSNMSRFPIRNGTHISDMSYDQLRDAFGRTATLLEKATEFRERRLRTIPNGLWKPIPKETPYYVAHLMPIESMSGRGSVNISEMRQRQQDFQGYRWNGVSSSFNLDGLLLSEPNGGTDISAYTQAFRNGCIETLNTSFVYVDDGRKFVASAVLACAVRDCLARLISAAKKANFNGSAVAALTIAGVKGYTMFMGSMFNMHGSYMADRDVIALPEHWIESLEAVEIDDVAKPMLDMAWQAFNLEKCSYYDDAGVWSPNRRFQ